MIEPTAADIGRAVVYTGNRYPGGKLEDGVITSFHPHAVFVRYGKDAHSKATARRDLEWRTNDLFRPNRCPCGLPWAECPWARDARNPCPKAVPLTRTRSCNS
jgi:hypothetical protein